RTPCWISIVSGVLKVSWAVLDLAAGTARGTMLYAASSFDPSGRNAAPPCEVCVLNVAAVTFGITYGELVVFCCASTSIVEVSNRSGPERNRDPSPDTARIGEIPAMFRLESTVAAIASYTNTVRVLFARMWTPMIVFPSAEAWRRALAARYMMLFG